MGAPDDADGDDLSAPPQGELLKPPNVGEEAPLPLSAADDESTDRTPPWRKIPWIGRMRTAGRALAAGVGIVAAVASVVVGYLAIPKSISPEDWARRVNAICEKNAGELRDPLRSAAAGLASFNVLLQDPANVAAAGADLTTTAIDIQDTADSYRQVMGEIREIDQPRETSKIDSLLDAGAQMYESLDSIAQRLTSASSEVASYVRDPSDEAAQSQLSEDLTALTLFVERDAGNAVTAYQQAVARLDLKQCQVKSTPPPESPESPGVLNEEEVALAHLFAFDPAQCSPVTTPAPPTGAVARVNCSLRGLEHAPFFISFSSREDLESWFGADKDRFDDCGAGKKAEYPLDNSLHPGRLRCFSVSNGYRVDIMLTNELVIFSAEAAGPNGLLRRALELVDRLDHG